MREQSPLLLSISEAKRRSTRLALAIPLHIIWVDNQAGTLAEETSTVSINCHGFRYFSTARLQKNSLVIFQFIETKGEATERPPTYPGRVASVRKSPRAEGRYLVGVEFRVPLNVWDVKEIPEDWAAFSPGSKDNPGSFLAEIDGILKSAREATYYQLLGVQPGSSRAEMKRQFYRLAQRFHPDHHMNHPEWTPRLVALMEGLTSAYETLSDDEAKTKYDLLLAHETEEIPSGSRELTQVYLDRARECMLGKNFAGCILWLHRAIENEPRASSHRAMLGRCLSAIPEYWREAVEQFEMAIDLDSRNLIAHFHYGQLLERLKAPWRARAHYLRVLELDANHWEAQKRVACLGACAPRVSAKLTLLGRLTGRR